MKILIRIFLIIALLCVPAFAQEPPQAHEQFVYITWKGTHYHLENCRTIQNSEKLGISITEAKQKNYLPCGVCKPGE